MKTLKFYDGKNLLHRKTGVDGVTDITSENGTFIIDREDDSRELIRSSYTTFKDDTDYNKLIMENY